MTRIAQNGGSASAITSGPNGNTLTDSSGRVMTWDSQNRMVSCTKGGVTSTYTYGADGLRRSSTVNGITTYYVYDGQTMIREMKMGGDSLLHPAATYLQGPCGSEYRRDDTATELDSLGNIVAKTRWEFYDDQGPAGGRSTGQRDFNSQVRCVRRWCQLAATGMTLAPQSGDSTTASWSLSLTWEKGFIPAGAVLGWQDREVN